jgi:hypothetical protein
MVFKVRDELLHFFVLGLNLPRFEPCSLKLMKCRL